MLPTAIIAMQVGGAGVAFAGWLQIGFWLALLAAVASAMLFLLNRRRDGPSNHLAGIPAGHPDPLLTIDPEGRISWINPAMVERFGRSAREATGRMVEDILPGALLAALRKPEGWSTDVHEHRLTGVDGRGFWVEARATPLPDGQILLSLHEVTGLKDRETALTKARDEHAARALHDPLTGLPNRAAVEPRLAHEIVSASRRSRRIGVLHLDLKEFSPYATAFGTAAADAALVAAANRLRDALEPGAYLGRFEGDRFVAVLSGPESDAPVERQANRLISALGGSMDAPGRPAFEVAAGLAILTDNASANSDPARLNSEAGMALNARKQERTPGLTRFTPEVGKRAETTTRLARELERARTARQFQPWFRPRIAPGNRQPAGLAVELRWRHPKRGALTAGQLVEEGAPPALVTAAASQILEHAIENFAAWRVERAFRGELTIPLPGVGPTATDFLDRLKLAADRHDLPPETIVVSFRGSESPARLFAEAGFRIERAAFGPDGASLDNLLNEATDVLRVSFAEMKDGEPEVLEALLALSKAADAKVLASDVASDVMLECAAALDIEQIEGPVAGDARPASDIPDLLSEAARASKAEHRKQA